MCWVRVVMCEVSESKWHEKGTWLWVLEPEQGEQGIHVREVDTTESIAVRDSESWFLTEGEGITKFGKREKQSKSRINYWYWIRLKILI